MADAQRIIPDARHEASDVGEGFVWGAVALLLGALVAVVLLAMWLFPQSMRDRTLGEPLPTYPAPRLQPSPRADMQKFYAEEMQRLNSTGWVDKAHGVVHIPIAEAMRKVAQEGIPGLAYDAGEAMKRLLLLVLLMAAGLSPGAAQGAAAPDPALFAYRQQTGSPLPPQARFHDADGGWVRLGELSHGLPLILVLAYFHCPGLCGIVRADLFHALGATALQAGRDYVLVVLSIDPAETSADATAARAQDLAANGLSGADGSRYYLTGSATDIQAVADAVGFRDRLDQQTKQFVHPAGIVFVTPGGIVSSYLLGVGYTPVDIRSAVRRAGIGRIAAAGAPVLLLCFHFDPTTGRYTLEIMKVLRLAGALTVATIAGMLFLLFRREHPRT